MKSQKFAVTFICILLTGCSGKDNLTGPTPDPDPDIKRPTISAELVGIGQDQVTIVTLKGCVREDGQVGCFADPSNLSEVLVTLAAKFMFSGCWGGNKQCNYVGGCPSKIHGNLLVFVDGCLLLFLDPRKVEAVGGGIKGAGDGFDITIPGAENSKEVVVVMAAVAP